MLEDSSTTMQPPSNGGKMEYVNAFKFAAKLRYNNHDIIVCLTGMMNNTCDREDTPHLKITKIIILDQHPSY